MPLTSTVAFVSPYIVCLSKPRRRVRHVTSCIATPNTQPPGDVDATIVLASQSLADTLSTGTKRARVSAIIPGLNPLIEDAVPYSDTVLNTLAYNLARTCPVLADQPDVFLLFKSTGTAAAARAALRPPEDVPITFGSYFRRDGGLTARASQHANIVVNPTSLRGDRVMDDLDSIIAEAPDAVWVLLNPDLGQERAAVGMREIARREEFLQSFANAFYFRNLFEIRRPQLIPIERGALLYVNPGPWRVFALAGGKYVLADDFEKMPDAEEITSCVRRTVAVATAPARKEQSETVDAQFLQVLAMCTVAFITVYAFLVIMPRS